MQVRRLMVWSQSRTRVEAGVPLAAEPHGGVLCMRAQADRQALRARSRHPGYHVWQRSLGPAAHAGRAEAAGGRPDCHRQHCLSLPGVPTGGGSGAASLGCKARFCQFTHLAVWSWGTY